MTAEELIATLGISPNPRVEVTIDVFDGSGGELAVGCGIERVSVSLMGIRIQAMAPP